MHALQVKWKGNGKIDPKYVHYVVQFLEHLGMTVGENEMKNLGYYKLDSIDKDLFCDNMYNGYVYENNLDKIKYKDWEQYNWTWLLRIKKLVELKLDFQLKWNFDLSSIVSYVIRKANEHSSTAVANESYSTAVANESYSTAVANEHSSTAVANKSYSTAVANGKNSIALTRSYKSKCRGKIGAWLVISEWDKMEENIIGIQAKKVDWVEIKENTFYTLKDWKFIEVPWN